MYTFVQFSKEDGFIGVHRQDVVRVNMCPPFKWDVIGS